MSALDDWPLHSAPPAWWSNGAAMTDEQRDAMAEEYAREQMATAQSEAAFEANMKEYRK